MKKLANKIAVITGASKGIGAGIAKTLASEGATVVVTYSSSRSGADRVVSDIVAAGGQATAISANVAVESEVVALFAAVKERFGRVDILVNNAGVYEFGALDSITTESFRKIYDVNVLGLLLVSKAGAALMPTTGGAIVNVSSAVSGMAPPMAAVYTSSKGAVDVITKSLAKELASRSIRVNAVNPGLIMTEGVVTAGIADSEFETQFVAMTPLGRAGQPEDVALPVLFLASDDSRYITGQTLYVSGGAGM
jgi:3-oxoacyl-[acyl-carrier protein] reductase